MKQTDRGATKRGPPLPTRPPTHMQLLKAQRPPKRDGRGSASRRGYGASWRKRRDRFLKRHPLCAICLSEGRTRQATCVDHVVPVTRGGADTPENWQALCASCHSRKTAREDGGFGRGG